MTREERIEKMLRLVLRGIKQKKIPDQSLVQGDKVIALSEMIEAALSK